VSVNQFHLEHFRLVLRCMFYLVFFYELSVFYGAREFRNLLDKKG
jgi:hypothetical protein